MLGDKNSEQIQGRRQPEMPVLQIEEKNKRAALKSLNNGGETGEKETHNAEKDCDWPRLILRRCHC